MSNFNEYFRKTGLPIIVNRFFKDVDTYTSDHGHKITKLDYELVKEPPMPASYYIENGLTASHKVLITYEMDSKPQQYTTEFSIPKEIDGAFIIEGNYRISTNKLNSSYECRFKTSGIGDHMINFDYNHQYLIDRKILRLRHYDPKAGVTQRPTEIPYDKIDDALLDPEKKELMLLTDSQQKKLMIKLDLDYRPEYITQKLIDECIAFGDDRIKDLIIDKEIDSVPQSFMQFLFRDGNGKNYFTARKRIMNYFSKYGKLQDETTAITNLAARFWKGGMIKTDDDKTATELQVPPGVNAVNLESLKSKITVSPTVAYNTTMTDLIDIGDTPILISR